MNHKCERCGTESLGLGWPQPTICGDCHPKWVCNKCGHTERKEEEVMCWKCGKGEMLYVPGKQAAAHLRKMERQSPNKDSAT